jgi:hypothetical protein
VCTEQQSAATRDRLLPVHAAPVEFAPLELADQDAKGQNLADAQAEGDVVRDVVINEPESRPELVVPD